MKKILANLIGKKFSVYVGGEFERMTDFIGFMKLLVDYADFFQYTPAEKREYLQKLVANRFAPVDANIYVKIGK